MIRLLKRVLLALLLVIGALLVPVGYVELACRPDMSTSDYAAILPPDQHRPESRTLLTYPEWHIVHAYDDYAEVIGQGDPHEFGFVPAVAGFWSSLCQLSETSGRYGGFPSETKQMVYTIGVSFTAEMLAKAAYEETVGRLIARIRGSDRAPLDDVSAAQAAEYAAFLQQVPWYKWDFAADVAELKSRAGPVLRDRERRIALGLEYRVKSIYARVIAGAVAQVGADNPRLRMIVTGLTRDQIAAIDGVDVIAQRHEGFEIETPRYRELTGVLAGLAASGAGFVEIAGNDDIMLTVISDTPPDIQTIIVIPRQGYGDTRSLIMTRVGDLAPLLRDLDGHGLRLEHVHDY